MQINITHSELTYDCATAQMTEVVTEKTIESPSLDSLKAKHKALVAEARYAFEVGGIDLGNGSTIKTDRESQATMTGAWVKVQQDPTTLIDWKSETGWTQLDKATIEFISLAVGNHVQGAFTKERQLCTQIDNLLEEDYESMLQTKHAEAVARIEAASVALDLAKAALAAVVSTDPFEPSQEALAVSDAEAELADANAALPSIFGEVESTLFAGIAW